MSLQRIGQAQCMEDYIGLQPSQKNRYSPLTVVPIMDSGGDKIRLLNADGIKRGAGRRYAAPTDYVFFQLFGVK